MARRLVDLLQALLVENVLHLLYQQMPWPVCTKRHEHDLSGYDWGFFFLYVSFTGAFGTKCSDPGEPKIEPNWNQACPFLHSK